MNTANDVHISVYTICKNESKFVDRWIKNMWRDGRGANKVYVLDTGSTDNTIEEFKRVIKEIGAPEDWLTVKIKTYDKFRFDVARNDNMDMIDEAHTDVLYCIDLDEIVIEDFWDDLRKEVFQHPNFSRIYYRYAWSHTPEGEPERVFWYDKITKPYWRWQYPVHESLYLPDNAKYNYQGNFFMGRDKIYLHHYPDKNKSRSFYLDLLKQRAEEYPADLYGIFYLAREYSFIRDYANALKWATFLYVKILRNNPSAEELKIRDDMFMLPALCAMIGHFYEKLDMKEEAQYYYEKGIRVAPRYRQNYFRLASLCGHTGKVELGFTTLEKMEENSVYIEDWRDVPYMRAKWGDYAIRGNLCSWSQDNKKAYQWYLKAINELKNQQDIQDFMAEGFHADFNFILNKCIQNNFITEEQSLNDLPLLFKSYFSTTSRTTKESNE